MNNERLRTLQLLELKILLEFKRICEKNNLKYFLDGGTLLGAVRHQGFIPWDDDIDVGMLRSEYEKFIKFAETELGPEYFLQTTRTDSGFAAPFAKIRLIGTEYKETITEGVLEHEEIWIDIFPYDNCPDNKLIKKNHIALLSFIEGMCKRKVGYAMPKSKSMIQRIGQCICSTLSKCISKDKLFNIRDNILQKSNKHKSELVWNPPFARDATYIETFSILPFESFQFPVPSRYHEFLSLIYGDYMQYPPEDKRIWHSPYTPKFGKYEYVKTIDDILELRKHNL